MNDRFYISKCPDTGRVFVCQSGTDNNIAEVFARNESETAGDNAQFICTALNKKLNAEAQKQTITIHAPSAEGLEHMVDFLTNVFADYKDSGEAPEQVFYVLGNVDPSDEEFE